MKKIDRLNLCSNEVLQIMEREEVSLFKALENTCVDLVHETIGDKQKKREAVSLYRSISKFEEHLLDEIKTLQLYRAYARVNTATLPVDITTDGLRDSIAKSQYYLKTYPAFALSDRNLIESLILSRKLDNYVQQHAFELPTSPIEDEYTK